MADFQILFNAAFGAILLILGWFMRTIFETVRDLRKKDQDIYDKVSDLAVTIPENYVHKNDFRDLNDRIFDKLDYIADKLDMKADK